MYCKSCKKLFEDGEKTCPFCKETLVSDLYYYACQLKNGDESAFDELYHSTQSYTQKMVLYYLTTHAIDTNLAEDCMQEVYLRLHQKIELFDDTKAAFSTWFETLRKNIILNFCEKMKKYKSEIGQEELELLQCEDISRMPEHLSDNDEISSIVSEMIDQLPEEQRICIRKFYMEEMKQDQIAKELGIPVGTVKSRLSKGKQKIGEMVLDLQKRGKKIYSFSPVLIFWWFFQDCAEACVGTATTAAVASVELLEKQREVSKVATKSTEAVTEEIAKVMTVKAAAIKAVTAAKAVTVGSVSLAKVISLVAVTGLVAAAAVGIGVSVSNSNTQNADENVEEIIEVVEEAIIEEAQEAEVEEGVVDPYAEELKSTFVEYWKYFVYGVEDLGYVGYDPEYDKEARFALVDVNHDNIPEFYLDSTGNLTQDLFTCYDGELQYLGNASKGTFYYYDKGNIFKAAGMWSCPFGGESEDYWLSSVKGYFRLEEGDAIPIAYYVKDEMWDSGDPMMHWIIGNPYSDNYEEVSEEEWNAYMTEIIPTGEKKEVDEFAERITFESVINAFQDYADEMGVDIDVEELVSEYDAAKKFVTNVLWDTYCYGNYRECKLDAQQTRAYIKAIEAMPETDIENDQTGYLECAFADIAGDGVPVLLMGYSHEADWWDVLIGDLNVWHLKDGQASMYDFTNDMRKKNEGLSIGTLRGEKVLCLVDGQTLDVGDYEGRIWYQVQQGELKKFKEMEMYAESDDYTVYNVGILDGEKYYEMSAIPWEIEKTLSEKYSIWAIYTRGLSKTEMLQCLNEYLVCIE